MNSAAAHPLRDPFVWLGLLLIASISFWWFPGHSILQSDTQVYIPILEHLFDNSVLRNDIMAVRAHVQWTVYDEVALALRRVTGFAFEELLSVLQVLSRLGGVTGLYLLARYFGLATLPALAAAAIVSLGALVHGPTVLTVEYEPVPRGFAWQLALLSVGCLAQGWSMGAAVAGAIALAFHPPSAAPAYLLALGVLAWRRRWASVAVLGTGILLLLASAAYAPGGTERPSLFTAIDDGLLRIQQARSSYNWVSLWWERWWRHYSVVTAFAAIAIWRLWRIVPAFAKAVLVLAPVCGLASIGLSWLLLEELRWMGAAQLQPARYLLLLTLTAVLTAAVAGLADRTWVVRVVLLTFAFAVPMNPDVTLLTPWQYALAAGLALLGSMPRTALAPALLAFLLLPTVGTVQPIAPLHTPELDALAAWARSSTPMDAVFQFADVRRGLQPGVFRARAVRAIYADWKAGGQTNFLPEFAVEWWRRWKLVEKPKPLAFYGPLGIDYVVFTRSGLPDGGVPVYSNSEWAVVKVR